MPGEFIPEKLLIVAEKLCRQYGETEKQVPFETSAGINQTAKDIRDTQKKRIG